MPRDFLQQALIDRVKQGPVKWDMWVTIGKPGDPVTAGQRLGGVGYSGMAAFPHVHLSVRRNGVAVDPFRPSTGGAAFRLVSWSGNGR